MTRLSGSSPERQIREFIAEDGQFDFEDNGYVVTFPDDSAKRQAVEMMNAGMLPAPREWLAKEVARLCLLSAGNKLSADDRAAYVAAMVDELSELPADIARDSLAELRRTTKWLPTAAELHDASAYALGRRERLSQAVRRAEMGR